MAGPRTRVPFRRRREGRTDYRHRLAQLRSRLPRLVVRRTGRNVVVQFANFDPAGDTIAANASALDLPALGWKGHTGNVPAAYLAGLLAGRRAKGAGVAEAVLDIGHQEPVPRSSLFAALQGVLDAGIEVPHGDKVLPDAKRLSGEHVSAETTSNFNEVKARILKEGAR